MAPASNEEQFKFLISCIRWSNSGKIDFGEVANECGIVTKGAAAKRYERMMKSHGIAPNAASTRAIPAARTIKTERKESSTVVKKRKMETFANDHGASVDDDEIFDNVKPDPENRDEQLHVKQEPGQTFDSVMESSMAIMPSFGGGSQEYLHGNGAFEQKVAGLNIHSGQTNGGNLYALPQESNFMRFDGYEQTATNNGGSTEVPCGDHQQNSIMIMD